MFKPGDILIRTAVRPESLYGIGSIVQVIRTEPASIYDPYNRPYLLTVRILKPTLNGTRRSREGKSSLTDPREFTYHRPISKTKELK